MMICWHVQVLEKDWNVSPGLGLMWQPQKKRTNWKDSERKRPHNRINFLPLMEFELTFYCFQLFQKKCGKTDLISLYFFLRKINLDLRRIFEAFIFKFSNHCPYGKKSQTRNGQERLCNSSSHIWDVMDIQNLRPVWAKWLKYVISDLRLWSYIK